MMNNMGDRRFSPRLQPLTQRGRGKGGRGLNLRRMSPSGRPGEKTSLDLSAVVVNIVKEKGLVTLKFFLSRTLIIL
jgi:hypothetical protein